MSSKGIILSFIIGMLGPSLVNAITTDHVTALRGFKGVGTLWGGLANITAKAESSSSFIGTDNDLFLYHGNNNSKTSGVFGFFLGTEHKLPYRELFMQTGIEYGHFGKVQPGGINQVGIEPATSTQYSYNYNIHIQQVMAVAKLFTTTRLPMTTPQTVYPYLSIGLGASFNNTTDYSATAHESGSVNITPAFPNKTCSSFSYNVGVGIDSPLTQRVRFGFGYQFSSFGRAESGNGQIGLNQHTYPVPFSLNTPNTYANQLIAHLSYIV